MASVASYIESHIIREISTGKYSPGSNIPSQTELASRMGVDRCSLRASLKALEREGWIRIKHGTATEVMGFSANCTLSAGLSRVHYVDDEESAALLVGALTMFYEVMLLLQEKSSLTQEFQYSEKVSPTYAINYELKEMEMLLASSNNKIYRLIINELTPLFRHAVEKLGVNILYKTKAAILVAADSTNHE